MTKETYYDILRVDKTASHDIIRGSYEKLLKNAKSQLQNSPLYVTRKKKLQDAYYVLSNPELRHAYDRKMSPEQSPLQTSQTSQPKNTASPETVPVAEESSFSFSLPKGFAVLIAFILVLIFFLPRNNDTLALRMANQQMQQAYEMQREQSIHELHLRTRYAESGNYMDYLTPEQREAAEAQRLEMEKRNMALMERREREGRRQQEYYYNQRETRESKRSEYNLQRQKEREKSKDESIKRREEYAAQKRSREFIRSTNRTTELIKKNERLKAGYD